MKEKQESGKVRPADDGGFSTDVLAFSEHFSTWGPSCPVLQGR